MTEGPPTNSESVEVSKNDVVESLKLDPEDLSLLHKFLDKREVEVQDSREALALNVEVAEIYRDAGLLEAAKEAFIQAAQQAWQEQDDTLHEQLLAEADKIQF
jgi:hypothetical protein